MGFHNTVALDSYELLRAEGRAIRQEDIVLAIFDESRDGLLTPEDVLERMPVGTPITSVRRAMSDLTKQGQLMKTQQFKQGPFGVRIHFWARVPMQAAMNFQKKNI